MSFPRSRDLIALWSALALVFVAACSTTTEPDPDPDPDPTISLTINPTSATVEQGASTTFDGTATLGGSFSGTVTFTVTGLPTGVTVTVGNVSTSGTTATATITIDVAAGVAAGSYPGTVTAAGSGVDASATYTLNVTAPTTGSYALGATPTALSVQRGNSGSVSVAITRTDFDESVMLAAEGLPTNVTAAFDPEDTTGDVSTLNLDVGAGASAGTTTVTIRGTSSLADVATTFELTVTDPPAGGLVLDYGTCDVDDRPIWVAYSDGVNGPFSVLNGVNDAYDLSGLSGNVVGLALVFLDGSDTDLTVDFADLSAFSGVIDACETDVLGKIVNANLVNTVGLTNTTLGPTIRFSAFDGPVQYMDVPDGNQPFVGFSTDGAGTNHRMVLRRDQDIANGGTLGDIDFTTEGFAPDNATISFTGIAAGEDGFVGMDYALPRAGGVCTIAPLHVDDFGPTFTGFSAPAAQQQAGEFHVAGLTAGTTSVGVTTSRWVKEAFSTLADRTVALPTQVAAPTITDVSGAGNYLRLEADVNIPADVEGVTLFTYSTLTQSMTVFYTSSLLTGNATITFPDLSGLAGWDDAWAVPASATGVDYNFTSGFGEDLFTGFQSALCTEGGRFVFSSVFGPYN
ncbi:MAG: hypothetical protein AAF389_02610 [Gemmatimonadota bacterium]